MHGRAVRTTFMVMREGRLVFEGSQDELEASADPYISKFVKAAGITYAGSKRKYAGRN